MLHVVTMFKVDARSRSYCVSTYPRIQENEFGPSFLHNLVVGNESSQAAMVVQFDATPTQSLKQPLRRCVTAVQFIFS